MWQMYNNRRAPCHASDDFHRRLQLLLQRMQSCTCERQGLNHTRVLPALWHSSVDSMVGNHQLDALKACMRCCPQLYLLCLLSDCCAWLPQLVTGFEQ
jgi:hypothetical protein